MGRIASSAFAVLLMLGFSSTAEAQLRSLSVDLNTSIGFESSNLSSRGTGGSLGAGVRSMYGRYTLQAGYETYWPSQETRAYVFSGRIGLLWSRKGGRIKGRMIKTREAGYRCTASSYNFFDKDGDWATHTTTRCGFAGPEFLVIPSGYMMDTKGWSLGYRHVFNGTESHDKNIPQEPVLFNAGAPTLSWMRTGSFQTDKNKTFIGALIGAEAYVYLVGDEYARFRPGGAFTAYLLSGPGYIGPRLRLDFATGFEFVVNLGVAYDLASLF